ncbi:MAG TPA: rod shape-determining protein MreC [Candidatus Dormibacteraeota bacterium]|nr:rod shape-determining protein MreC [Candidatus Dormibacteraeota bacterium]
MNRGPTKRLIALTLLGATLAVVNAAGALAPVKAAIAYAIAPAQMTSSQAGSSGAGFFDVLFSINQLSQENKRLRQENASLRQRISQNTELKAENESLRKQLNFTAIEASRLVGGEVIGYQPDNFRHFITINRGSADGIASGMAVVSEGSLVGTISEVTAGTAKVFLVVDPNFRVSGVDQDRPSRPTGTVRGQIGGGFLMDKIAQNEDIRPGDAVITSGLGTNIPKGIMIGRIETVQKLENGVFQNARLVSDLKFNRLEYVYVIVR